MLSRLIEILGQETTLYKELLFLLQEEKSLLSKRVTDKLHKLAGSIETLMIKAKSLQELRVGLVDELAKSYGLVVSDNDTTPKVKLSNIIQAVEGSHKELLKDLQSKLLALVERIEALSKENSLVINYSINNIKAAYLFLKEISTPSATYQASGKMG